MNNSVDSIEYHYNELNNGVASTVQQLQPNNIELDDDCDPAGAIIGVLVIGFVVWAFIAWLES